MRAMQRPLLLLLVLAACPGGSQPQSRPARPVDVHETPPTTKDPGAVQDTHPTPVNPPPTGGEGAGLDPKGEGKKADGADCLAADECVSGICEGQGCADNQPGKCMPRARGCTRDLRSYCGCDGKTFQTSGSCPGRRFASRGRCEGS